MSLPWWKLRIKIEKEKEKGKGNEGQVILINRKLAKLRTLYATNSNASNFDIIFFGFQYYLYPYFLFLYFLFFTFYSFSSVEDNVWKQHLKTGNICFIHQISKRQKIEIDKTNREDQI